MRIGLLHPGEMGAAIGAVLVRSGHEVLWLPEGRSPETRRRAEEAGLTAVEEMRDTEIILSVCPPQAAVEVARSLTDNSALVVDANAVSPGTATRIGELLEGHWVDAAIVGPPPTRAGTTRLYLSGSRAAEVARLFAGSVLEPVTLTGSPVDASALKMAYAAWTKGSAALLLSALDVARANGVQDALLTEWSRSQPDLQDRVVDAAESAASKGWRWTAEMDEIATTYSAAGLPPGFHQAAADIYARAAGDHTAS